MTTALCDVFQLLAALTWERIRGAYSVNLKWSEETNTETLLLELKNRFPGKVGIRAFSRKDEADNGADWEWWLVGKNSWGYPMRVQAKRIKLPKENFGHLGYKAKNQPDNQMDTLIRMARQTGMPPMYCFYTHSPITFRCLACRNQIAVSSCGKSHGCLVGHAQFVKLVHSNRLSDLSKILVPWHKLVCPHEASASDLDLSEIVEGAMKELISSSGDSIKYPDPANELIISRRKVPGYVTDLLSYPSDHVEVPSSLERLAAERGIKGIIAVQQSQS